MAASNLYPPIISSTLPAFMYEDSVYSIPFSISNYNSCHEISAWIQMTIVNPYTGVSILNPKKYPNGIISILAADVDESGSYLTASASRIQLNSGSFEKDIEQYIGGYYRIQIRFCMNGIDLPDEGIEREVWYRNHIDNFSEWSKGALVRIIGKPTFKIEELKDYQILNRKQVYHLSSSLLSINGLMQIDNGSDFQTKKLPGYSEPLKSYRLKLFDESELLQDSGNIMGSNNHFSYVFKYELSNSLYQLYLSYETLNGYTQTLKYNIILVRSQTDKDFISAVNIQENQANASLRISVTLDYTGKDIADEDKEAIKYLLIRRSDNFKHYQEWETIHIVAIPLDLNVINYVWQDTTVQSGVWYQYRIRQGFSSVEETEPSIYSSFSWVTDKMMIDIEDILLSSKDNIIKIKYNPQIDGLKYITQNSITPTLGSKYPYVRRNGKTCYRQFTLKGLISSAMDEDEIFISKSQKYQDYYSYYERWREQNNIYTIRDLFINPEAVNQNGRVVQKSEQFLQNVRNYYTNDRVWERHFRDQIISFLQNNQPKLFRSGPQGNMLIYINDVSLTPQVKLGRNIYTVTLQCVQIADSTIQNYDKYGIIQTEKLQSKYIYVLNAEQYDNNKMQGTIQNIWIASNNEQQSQELYNMILNNDLLANIQQQITIEQKNEQQNTTATIITNPKLYKFMESPYDGTDKRVNYKYGNKDVPISENSSDTNNMVLILSRIDSSLYTNKAKFDNRILGGDSLKSRVGDKE